VSEELPRGDERANVAVSEELPRGDERTNVAVSEELPRGALTADQRAFLEQGPRHMYLFVNTARGPVGYPMTGVFERDTIWFTTYRTSRKVRHLEADDRVCCLYAPPATEHVAEPVLSVRGHAAVTRDIRAFTEGHGDAPLEVSEQTRQQVADRLRTGKRVVFAVRIVDATTVTVRGPGEEGACHVEICP